MQAAATRTSLVEQKRIQWAKEREFSDDLPRLWNTISREEMSRLTGNRNGLRSNDTSRTTIRTYPNGHRASLSEMNGNKQQQQQHQQPKYASTISLRSIGSDHAYSTPAGLCQRTGQLHDLATSASLANLQDYQEFERASRIRSPSLPPIVHPRDEYRYQDREPSTTTHSRQSRHSRCARNSRSRRKDEDPDDGPEGETSGYASDNLDAAAIQRQQRLRQKDQQTVVLPCNVNGREPDSAMGERTWQNPYGYGDENSLPASRKLANLKAGGESHRQCWGSIWGQDISKDPPPPSWLERGLSRLDHSSQVLVINHDSASSPDSSTTGSLGSDTNKTYLRGHNVPVDADVLQEREARRQKALELQNAIKEQLAERERKRTEEREKKLREERAEEERIQRERDVEKQRLEEEQRRQREKEAAKQKKSQAMQEMLEAAERRAKEERRLQHQRRRRENDEDEEVGLEDNRRVLADKETKQATNRRESMDTHEAASEPAEVLRVPVSQEVAIVLSARIDDPDLLSKSPLKLVNLVMSPTPARGAASRTDLASSLNALLAGGFGSPVVLRTASPRITENRLLTPSKYRQSAGGRDCGTQTDCEGEFTDYADKLQEARIKETKERKEAINRSRKDVDKSTNTDTEPTTKSLPRNKQSQQIRASLESRPRWNANRPGTRYRTQSEKDPHYQRRMRLRRRQVETSDEGSSDFRRSPSPGRHKHGIVKAKSRNSMRRKAKNDHYDADASMDSLNSLVPLHTDKDGRINIERPEQLAPGRSGDNVWCGENILTHLHSLRNGLIMKKKEWDLQECPITPITELY